MTRRRKRRARRARRARWALEPADQELREEVLRLVATNGRTPVGADPVFLTAYCDASLRDKQEVASWAMWGRDRTRRVLAAGPCPEWVFGDSTRAELCGVVGATLVCLDSMDAASSNILVVKTDSQSVCGWFGWRGGSGGQPRLPRGIFLLELVRLCLLKAAAARVKLVVTWVKGHQGQRSTRGYLNDRVDGMARRAREDRLWSYWTVLINGDRGPAWRDQRDRGLPFVQSVERHLCRPLLNLQDK
jgi:ribonuclease HI